MKTIDTVVIPTGYSWILEHGWVSYEPFTQLQPWHYLLGDQCFWVSEKWKTESEKRLFAYAKRQDCDDFACFIVNKDNTVEGIAVIHGWTENGYDICSEFPDFWSWLKYVVDNISEWVSMGE